MNLTIRDKKPRFNDKLGVWIIRIQQGKRMHKISGATEAEVIDNAKEICKRVNAYEDHMKLLKSYHSIYSDKKKHLGLTAIETGILVTIEEVLNKSTQNL